MKRAGGMTGILVWKDGRQEPTAADPGPAIYRLWTDDTGQTWATEFTREETNLDPPHYAESRVITWEEWTAMMDGRIFGEPGPEVA